MHTYIHAYIHTYMHIYIYIHTYIHTYTCMYIHIFSSSLHIDPSAGSRAMSKGPTSTAEREKLNHSRSSQYSTDRIVVTPRAE